MLIGHVIGNITSTVKHGSLDGQKLLVVQPRMADGKTPDGDPLVAVDAVGAGMGETVVISSDSESVREFLAVTATPARWAIVGIQDELTESA